MSAMQTALIGAWVTVTPGGEPVLSPGGVSARGQYRGQIVAMWLSPLSLQVPILFPLFLVRAAAGTIEVVGATQVVLADDVEFFRMESP